MVMHGTDQCCLSVSVISNNFMDSSLLAQHVTITCLIIGDLIHAVVIISIAINYILNGFWEAYYWICS